MIVAIGACEPAPQAGGASVRDSLGVRIVDHGDIDISALPQWSLEVKPVVSIGVAEGDDAYQLFGVIDAHRSGDGSIAVVDRSRSLRVFDSLGVHVWTTGRRGDGPGEFGWPQMVTELNGDSLLVWDVAHSRLTVFSADGALERTSTVSDLLGDSPSLGLGASGRLLNEHRVSERTLVDGRPVISTDSEVVLLDVSGGEVTFVGREFLVAQFEDRDGNFGPATFAVPSVFALAPGGYWYGNTQDHEVRRVTTSGLETVLRWVGSDRAISEADYQALLHLWAGGSAATLGLERSMREYGRSMPRATRFPAYAELRTDGIDRLRVRDYVRAYADDGTRRWTVFSADGTGVVARLFHSTSFRPVRIGADWILGVETDEFDVERVVLREIVLGSERDSS